MPMQGKFLAMGAHIEFDETAQKMQLRHDLASTTTAMGVLDAWHQPCGNGIEITIRL